jgi:Leucine-rich repeat (LRR) protein
MNSTYNPTKTAILKGKIFLLCLITLIFFFPLGYNPDGAWGAIPDSERAVLLNLYTSTNGSAWTNKANWTGPAGTECTWYGVYCDEGGNHVVFIYLGYNNLIGTLPSLAGLERLQTIDMSYNHLSGSIPSLAGLTDLQIVNVNSNQLTGQLPSLSGISGLHYFNASYNQLSGPMPGLSGLANLSYFDVYLNQLTGQIPLLSGLANLQHFNVGFNKLTGPIPALTGLGKLQELYLNANQLSAAIPSMSDLTSLQYLALNNNQLTGPIPSLNALANLLVFDVSYNQLTGSMPSLGSLTALKDFRVHNNQLSGSIPSLSGLANLSYFYAHDNQFTGLIPPFTGLAGLRGLTLNNNLLTGSIPSLTGISALEWFDVSNNQLTGAIPSLTGLASLHIFSVDYNYLSGDAPAVPSPNNLTSGQSQLCPNNLHASSSTAWDAATATTPWYQQCSEGPTRFSVNYDGNGSTGGSVPDSGTIYATGETVVVLGNSGALVKNGSIFDGWNTAANGSGTSYAGGATFLMGSGNVVLSAKWADLAVRILETGVDYTDIQDAYDQAANGNTIEAWSGFYGHNVLFNRAISVKLMGGYDATFTSHPGLTIINGMMEIRSGSAELSKIVIQ